MLTDLGMSKDILGGCKYYSGIDGVPRSLNQSVLDRLVSKTQTYYRGSSCGKCILSGEHSVVYGGWCVCSPLIQLSLEVDLYVFEDKNKTQSSSDDELFITEVDPSTHKILWKMFTKAQELLNVEIKDDVVIKVESDFPLGAGLGGSAALSSALIDSIVQYKEEKIDIETKLKLCNELEKINHLNPSGVDSYVVVKKQVVLFKKNGGKFPIKIDSGRVFSFLLIDSMQRSKTSDMIEKVKDYFKSVSLVSEFDRCSLGVKQALETKDMDLMKDSLNKAGFLLKSIGLYTQELMSMELRLKELGVAALKPTGACGGGMMLVLLDPEQEDQEASIRQIYGDRGIFKFFL